MKGKNDETKAFYELYVQNRFKALKCAGYHPRFNKETDPVKRYKRAKQPITKGFTSSDYESLSLRECEQWEAQGGWTGWVIPKGVIALDVEDKATIEIIGKVCSQQAINPPEHVTNNGRHFIFKTSVVIPGNSKAFTKAGIKVTYRAGGKNPLILAPTNGRTWATPLNGNLPKIPVDLMPFDRNNTDDLLNILRRRHPGHTELGSCRITRILIKH